MTITIHRGTHEIGGTLIELQSGGSRILLDAGFSLIDAGNKPILPEIAGLYKEDAPAFDGIIISHARAPRPLRPAGRYSP